MREIAQVIKTETGYATVSVNKKDECSKCGMCAFPKGADKIELRAKNSLNAKVGDKVLIERQEGGKLSGALLVFFVPLLLIGIATLLAYTVLQSEMWVLWLSVIFIAVWFVILAIIDKKLVFLDKFCAEIIQIQESENKEKLAEKENAND